MKMAFLVSEDNISESCHFNCWWLGITKLL